MRRAKPLHFVLCAVIFLSAHAALAAPPDEENDTTVVTDCDKLPPTASIEVFSWRQTATVCQQMTKILQGVRIKDIRTFEKAGFLLREKDCGPDTDEHAVGDLVEIVRRRGLFDNLLDGTALSIWCGVCAKHLRDL